MQEKNNISKTKILFIGAYGIENAGDDLPMLTMIDNLKKMNQTKKFEFHSLSRHPNKWEEREYNIIQHQNLEYNNKKESSGKWIRGLNFDDDRSLFYDFLKLIKSMDLLIIGAGNFIIDISIDIFRGPIPLIWWYIHIAKLYNKKVFLYGFSAAPLKNEYAILLTKEILHKSDIVTVRDKMSKEYLKSIDISKNIIVLPDPTIGVNIDCKLSFLKPTDSDIVNKKGKKKIALGLRNLDFISGKGRSAYKAILDFINSNPQYYYIFIPQSTYFDDNDIDLAKKISRQIKKYIDFHIIDNRYNPKDIIKIYSLCDITISIRLHSAIFSHISGTPVIAINYLPKVKAYMQDFGMPELMIDIEKVSLNTINKKIMHIEKYNQSLKLFIKKTIKNKQKKVEKYVKLASSLLK